MTDYISIKDYAQIKGLSVQRVYQKLNKELKPYLKIINNKKFLDSSVLKLEEPQAETIKTEQITNDNQELINSYKQQIEMLNKQIDLLSEQLKIKDKQIEDITGRLQESLILNQNNQVLLLETHKKHFWSFKKGKQEQKTKE